MPMSNITVDMDADLKLKFEEVANELGIGVTAAVTAFAKAMVRQQAMPFALALKTPEEIEEARFYSEPNVSYLLRSREQVDRGEVVTFDSVEEFERATKATA